MSKEKLLVELSNMVGVVIDELNLHEEMGIFDKALSDENLRTVEEYLDSIRGSNVRDNAEAAKALGVVRNYYYHLIKCRKLFEMRKIVGPRLHDFADANDLLYDERVALFTEARKISDPAELKKWLGRLESESARKQAREAHELLLAAFRAKAAAVTTEEEVRQDAELEDRAQNLKTRASNWTSDEAKVLYEEGLKCSSRHAKIRLFKASIRADMIKEEPVAFELSKKDPRAKVVEFKQVNLHELMDDKLAFVAGLVGPSNQQMCVEILKFLAQFGRRGGYFEESYLPFESLRKLVGVRFQKRLQKPFDAGQFERVISLLAAAKVLIRSDRKMDDWMISLSSRPSRASSPEASAVIARVLALKRETNGGNHY